MYGGLFGALPPTKNAKKSQDEQIGEQKNELSNNESSSVSSAKTRVAPASNTTPEISLSIQGGPTTAPNKNELLTSSIVRKLGSAGTTMAFVPNAARQRRRPNSNNPKQPLSMHAAAISQLENAEAKRLKTTSEQSEGTITSSTSTDSVFATSFAIVETTYPVEQHQHKNDSSRDVIDDAPISSNGCQPNTSEVSTAGNYLLPQSEFISPQQESEELRELHEQAKENMYDPYVPNDLLEYWHGKALAAQREQLERERQQAYEEQDRINKQLERERRELERVGDIDKLIAHHQSQRPVGRGRGVSNLPAWVVEKQKRESVHEKRDG